MRSHLTRHVFRRLLLNEPIFQHNHCHTARRVHLQSRKTSTFRPSLRNSHRATLTSHVTRRTLFGFFEKPDREAAALNLDPGMDKMLELDKRIHLQARLPPAKDLAKAFNTFFNAKSGKNRIIEDFHANMLLQTWESIKTQESEDNALALSQEDLLRNLMILSESQSWFAEVHEKLARGLYAAIHKNGTAEEKSKNDTLVKSLSSFVTVLCRVGKSVEAREELKSWCNVLEEKSDDMSDCWAKILQGFTKQNDGMKFNQTLDTMTQLQMPLTIPVHRALVVFYAKQNDLEKTKQYFKPQILNQTVPKPGHQSLEENVYQIILEFCIRNKQIDWAQQVFPSDNERSPDQHTWDAIFGAAAATGKSVEDIDRMIGVVVRREQETGTQKHQSPRPEIGIFNSLIRFAISKNDSYTAERYVQLSQKWKSEPDATMHMLQIEYRLAAGDLDGAMTAYNNLDGMDVPDGADWPILNKLLQTLVRSPSAKERSILRVIADVSDRNRVIYSDTVLALCTYHLKRDEYFEVVDLLHTYAFQFSTSQRIKIRNVLSSFTLDPSTDTGRAWDTYMIFHQVFDRETRREIRNEVMSSFFRRKRPDLAMHVFMQMSKHMRADTRPDVETYSLAFEGIALNEGLDNLLVIHNLFKLDVENEPCTRVLNAMMLAYAACDEPLRSLEIWQDIATSVEGPDLKSIHIAFRASEKAPFGYEVAKAIWEKLHQTDIVIDRFLLTSYIGALAGGQQLEEAKSQISKTKDVTGEEPDMFLMATLFNASLGTAQQEQVEQFVRDEYPHLWTELEKRGFDEDATGWRQVKNIDRTLRA